MECTCKAGSCECGTVVNGVMRNCGCMEVSTVQKAPLLRYLDTYGPLLVLLLGVDCGAIEMAGTLQTQLSMFMALLYLVFGVLQLRNLKEYVPSLARYNLVVKRFPLYGYMLPFLELILGLIFAYNGLVRTRGISRLVPNNPSSYYHLQSVLHASPLLFAACILTIAIFSIDVVGVITSLRRGNRPTCACLGVLLAVPLSPLTVLEDLLMIIAPIVLLLSIAMNA